MTKVTIQSEKTNLEKFYQGFHSFTRIYVEDDKATFYVDRESLVKSCMLDAERRIKELQLPLLVTRPNPISRHFIVSVQPLLNSERIVATCMDVELTLDEAMNVLGKGSEVEHAA